MLKRIIYILVLLISFSNFGQGYTKHTVAKGETISSIAQKYKVTPYDIYKLNPDSQNGIKENFVLLIPGNILVETTKKDISNNQVHVVKADETLYSILKLYNITPNKLENNNPILKNTGLKIGQELIIHKNTNPPKVAEGNKTTSTYEVVSGDTKYSISKKFGVSVEELEVQNPEIKENLPLGFILKINPKTASTSAPKVVVDSVKPQSIAKDLVDYVIKPGETLYSLTHLFNISENTLIGLNPKLKEAVKEGMVVKIPANAFVKKETKNNLKDVNKINSNHQKKQLVLFLPFNVSKIQNDTINSVSERLKKDKFLNMTLDFYSGALMAIDSAKVLGINVNVNIFDSEETKNSTGALSIISNKDFSYTDAVIGPFYQVNVEKVASALENKNIPVISPLSKEEGNSYSNLFQSMPQNNLLKSAMFEYMHSKNGNIIGVLDPKKLSFKQYLRDFQKDVRIVGYSDKGVFVNDSLKRYFVKDRINYVVLASEKTGTILSVTTLMQNVLKEYKLQLVVLEPNETLDYEEISLSRLTKLKLIYPSSSKENDTEEAQKFANAYKKKNKILPNQYAIRGFDLTFDTMFRLSQGQTFEDSVNANASEQIQSKFDYTKKSSGGYANNGIYILYYDEDLTIKQAQ